MVLKLWECIKLELSTEKLMLSLLKHRFRIIVYKLDNNLIRLRIKFIDYCLDHKYTHWFFWPILRWYLKFGKWLDDGDDN